ncbi:hypothetical protein B9Z55_027583 [Caenorhabditis nigoni]|uniref:Uncharacterized protein n=1 Tax=Caenorhabditis nigoni TaxID=1611254 RepID=A0A2G5SFR7_9PELO|nr:hypothetical protein B9Z55_027582 [Caenorhabditis nigoni]PIC13722.1 hypothetical protein B9Z55_027583 [Caenorhabditis nigoni]
MRKSESKPMNNPVQEEIEHRAVKETAQSNSGRATVSTQITKRRMERQNLCKNYSDLRRAQPASNKYPRLKDDMIRIDKGDYNRIYSAGSLLYEHIFRSEDLSKIIMKADLDGRLLELMQTSGRSLPT